MHANASTEDSTKGSLLESCLIALVVPKYMTLNGAGQLTILVLVHHAEETHVCADTQENHNGKNYK
jgi:hypothetical protein